MGDKANLQQFMKNTNLLSPFIHSSTGIFRQGTISNNCDEENKFNTSEKGSDQTSVMRSQYTIATKSCISKKHKNGKKQINQYIINKVLGKGQFAKVKKIFCTITKQEFAMKIINKDLLKRRVLSPAKSQFSQVEKEVAIMKKMGHPYILKLIEIIDDPNHHK